MTLEVRAYRASDQAAVVALWNRVFPDPAARNEPTRIIADKLAERPELFLVAETGEGLAGTMLAGWDGHRGWLHLVAVAPERRRQGVGRALLARAESLLAELGCTKLNLQVRGSEPEAVGFYERLGYAVEDRISLGKPLGCPDGG